MKVFTALTALAVLCTPLLVSAQEIAHTPPVSNTKPDNATSNIRTILAGSLVDFEIVTPLNSKTSKIGDTFDIRLVQPIMADGAIAVPVGAIGKGEVIHAAKARAAGKAGELILAARYIEFEGNKLALRSFHFGASGDTERTEAFLLSTLVASPLGFLVVGGNVEVPAHSLGHAKLANDFKLPPSATTPADTTLPQQPNP